MVGLSSLIAAATGLALAWDGSWYLFTTLDSGRPSMSSDRLINIPLQLPALAVRRLTNDLGLSALAFGLAYFAVPVVALAASWWIVRRRDPGLFVWAALGIGLVALPGQPFAVSETMMAIQLSWPILLAIVTGSIGEHRVLIAALSVVVALAAPVAVPLLIGLAVAVLIVRLWVRDEPRLDRRWALGFLALAGLATARSVWSGDIATHAIEATIPVLITRFDSSVAGLPLVAVTLTWAAAALLVVGTAVRPGRPDPAGTIDALAVLAVVAAGAALLVWAATGGWANALNFRAWLQFFSVPLLALAVVDGMLRRRRPPGVDSGAAGRRWIVFGQGVATLLVMTSIGWSWRDLSGHLDAAMIAQPAGCITRDAVGWTNGTALDHWSLSVESLVLSGRTPTRIVLPSCAVDFSKGVRVTPWYLRRYAGGWFRLSALGATLTAGP